jgi:tetratricopeptide (TPR) repeat protein
MPKPPLRRLEELFHLAVALDPPQRQRIATYCEMKGLRLAEVFKDRGISAGKPLEPNAVYPRYELIRAYVQSGRYDRAIAEGERARTLSNDSSRLAAALGRAYAAGGHKDKARQVLADLVAKAKDKYVSAYGIATIYIGLGEREQALDWLGRACDEHSTALVYVNADPVFAELHAEPRFAAILQRIGLPDGH